MFKRLMMIVSIVGVLGVSCVSNVGAYDYSYQIMDALETIHTNTNTIYLMQGDTDRKIDDLEIKIDNLQRKVNNLNENINILMELIQQVCDD